MISILKRLLDSLKTRSMTKEDIKRVCDNTKNLLIKKNEAYGDSALNPLGIFGNGDAVVSLGARMDDKLMRLKSVSSIKAIRLSIIFAFDGKCLYSAASDTPTSLARAAVVMRFPGCCCSINAKASRICWRRLLVGLGVDIRRKSECRRQHR